MTRRDDEFDAGRSAGAHLADRYSKMAYDARAEAAALRAELETNREQLSAASAATTAYLESVQAEVVALRAELAKLKEDYRVACLPHGESWTYLVARCAKAETELAAARAQVAALREALEQVETFSDEFGHRCGWCDGFESDYSVPVVHADDCPRQVALGLPKNDGVNKSPCCETCGWSWERDGSTHAPDCPSLNLNALGKQKGGK